MSLKGPLADSYWSAVALVLMALTPFLVLSSAVFPLQEVLAQGTGLSEHGLELTNGMADAGYCFGTVLAVQLLPARRVLLVFAVLFVAAWVLAAWAPTPGLFAAGHIVQRLAPSLMLIAAVPPLIIGWDVARLRPTTTGPSATAGEDRRFIVTPPLAATAADLRPGRAAAWRRRLPRRRDLRPWPGRPATARPRALARGGRSRRCTHRRSAATDRGAYGLLSRSAARAAGTCATSHGRVSRARPRPAGSRRRRGARS